MAEPIVEEREIAERRQRLYFEVPNPRAWFCLGQPEARGYRGVSLGAADNLFVSVKGQALHQAVGAVHHVTMDNWYQASTYDSIVNAGATALVTANKQVIVIAGAGYGPDVQLELGDSPPAGYFNPTDYQDIMNPCRDGVRAYDTAFAYDDDIFRRQVGYDVKSSLAPSAAATGFKATVVAALFGAPVPPTANSPSIEQFARDQQGLYGKLMQLKRITDRLERWTSRPHTMPGVIGKTQEMMGDLGEAIDGLTSAYNSSISLVRVAAPGFMPDGKLNKGGLLADFGQEVAEARTNSETSRGDADWTKSANAVGALSGAGFRHILRPLANRIRGVSRAIQGITMALDSVANLLGAFKKTSALALVGKEGVSIVSPRRVFAYAADGFHFVTAKPEDPAKDWLDKLADVVPKWPWQSAPPEPVPGFTVRSAGDIEMSATGRVFTSARGPHGRMQMMSEGVAEFGAVDSAALTARKGTAEVLGKKVVVGSTRKRAKAAAMKVLPLAAAARTMAAAFAAVGPLREAYIELVEKRDRIRREAQALMEQMASDITLIPALGPERFIKSEAARAMAPAILAAKTALKAAVEALGKATDARDAIEAASDATAESAVAKALGWKAAKQSLADSVEIGAAASVGVYSADEVAIGAAKTIELVCEEPPPLDLFKMKISMGQQIEISASSIGVEAKIGVTCTCISITVQDTEILCTPMSIQLKAGPSSISISPAGVVIKGASITLDGIVNNG